MYQFRYGYCTPLTKPSMIVPHKGTSTSFGESGTGNMIVVREADRAKGELELISRLATDSARQLKGIWLAYWEHEIGRDERDVLFNLKQIKLKSFVGHTASVRSLAVLDNENSFLSRGKDRTVRLWLVRNTREGGRPLLGPSLCIQDTVSQYSLLVS